MKTRWKCYSENKIIINEMKLDLFGEKMRSQKALMTFLVKLIKNLILLK